MMMMRMMLLLLLVLVLVLQLMRSTVSNLFGQWRFHCFQVTFQEWNHAETVKEGTVPKAKLQDADDPHNKSNVPMIIGYS